MPRYFAKKTECLMKHRHDSKAEAERCNVLHDKFRRGELSAITVHPVLKFTINGANVVMGNGREMKFTPDFSYVENGRVIYEDVKPRNGYMSRDVPVKLALLRHLGHEIRITK